MGIKDLCKLIRKECPEELAVVNMSDIAGYKIAVDISIYLNKYVRSCGEKFWLDALINFIFELKRARLHPIFIFDGPNPPPEKKLEQEKRRAQRDKDEERLRVVERHYEILMRDFVPGNIEPPDDIQNALRVIFKRATTDIQYEDAGALTNFLQEKIRVWTNQTIRITPAFNDQVKDVLSLLGLPYTDARGEAETLCAYMGVNKYVDAVLTSDTDVLAYGTPCMISTVDRKRAEERSFFDEDNSPVDDATKIRVIDHATLCASLDLSPAEFKDLCILLSCDYNKRVEMRGKTKWLAVGAVRAFDLIKTHRSLDQIENYLRDPAPLNYRRCRELFTVPKTVVAGRFEFAKPIAEAEFLRFLKDHGSRIQPEAVQALWAPNK